MGEARGSSRALAIARYRLAVTWRRRLGGYLSVALLVGLLGGVAMAAVAGARRTQSSYPTFLARTNPSSFTVTVYESDGAPGPDLSTRIRALPGVARVRDIDAPQIAPLSTNGAPEINNSGNVLAISSIRGEFFHQDRVAATAGRVANPARADEVMLTASAVSQLGYRLGDHLSLGLYTFAQERESGFGTPAVKPLLTEHARVVGIVVLNTQVVQDDVDRQYGFMFVTPALMRKYVALWPAAANPTAYAVKLRRGYDVLAAERLVTHVVPQGLVYQFHYPARVETSVELAVRPESVALGAFGGIAALVCLALGAQAVSRQIRELDGERRVIWSLGATSRESGLDGLIGVAIAIIAGVALALVVAIALSPLAPLGPVRPVYPASGVSFDPLVLGVGATVLLVGLGVTAAFLSRRGAPHRVRRRRLAPRSSVVARVVDAAGVPVAASMGVRMAVEPSRGRTGVPVRSVLVGTVVAVGLVAATLTFSSGLTTLVSRPPLYGWNWNYVLNPTNSVPPSATRELNHDPDVAAWSGYDYNDAQIDGVNVPILIGRVGAKVAPPVVSGRAMRTSGEIEIGQATLAALHKKIGDDVTFSYGSKEDYPVYVAPTTLKIVGAATFPAVGFSSVVADHTSMGLGALVPRGVLSAKFLSAVAGGDPVLSGPEQVFVRLRPGVSAAAGLTNLRRVARGADNILAHDPNPAAHG
ncbi:MAG: hypothetical protein ACRDV0_01700, partial [Acidimicrobiales bacterium]